MKNFPFSILIIKELYTFSKRVLDIVTTPLAENTYVKSLCKSLSDANTNLEKAMGRALTSEFTPILIEKDKVRDDVFIGLRDYVNAFTRNQIQAKSTAGLYLSGVIDAFGNTLYRDPYAIETAELNSLLLSLKKPEAVQSLTTLAGAEWVEQLTTAQDDFEKTYQDKVTTEASINYPLAAESKQIITKYMDSLLNYIDGNSEYESATFSPLKAQLEDVIVDVIAQARTRITVAARNKKEEQDAANTNVK